MAKQVIKLGETVKSILSKLNANFSELYTESAKITNKVDKVDGKGLSTNDFTNSYKEKLDRSTQVEKLTFASSVWGTAVDGYYTYTIAGGGKYPVKVMRQSDSDYVEAVVDIAMSGTNIVITSEEVFSGYVITI